MWPHVYSRYNREVTAASKLKLPRQQHVNSRWITRFLMLPPDTSTVIQSLIWRNLCYSTRKHGQPSMSHTRLQQDSFFYKMLTKCKIIRNSWNHPFSFLCLDITYDRSSGLLFVVALRSHLLAMLLTYRTFPAKHLPVELACHRTANRFKLDERLTAVTKVKTKTTSDTPCHEDVVGWRADLQVKEMKSRSTRFHSHADIKFVLTHGHALVLSRLWCYNSKSTMNSKMVLDSWPWWWPPWCWWFDGFYLCWT